MKTNRRTTKRYILIKPSGEVSQHHSMDDITITIGCSRAHIYKYMINDKVTFKKEEYLIIDKLVELTISLS
jgi:hypothetical protein